MQHGAEGRFWVRHRAEAPANCTGRRGGTEEVSCKPMLGQGAWAMRRMLVQDLWSMPFSGGNGVPLGGCRAAMSAPGARRRAARHPLAVRRYGRLIPSLRDTTLRQAGVVRTRPPAGGACMQACRRACQQAAVPSNPARLLPWVARSVVGQGGTCGPRRSGAGGGEAHACPCHTQATRHHAATRRCAAALPSASPRSRFALISAAWAP